ncbi:MAG: type II toxin-antitoxin system Phd/YefM family antitoxin [Verrucomicrobiota bacterium]|jgi:prevent-host-death family protein|nr:type II toxin-antitoxin system Phd/YefM family antitoxin [Verrucomicrobiota bacterium]
MKTMWALQDAKNKFSEVVEKTLADGPQTVMRRGVPVVVILPFKDYERRTSGQESLVAFFRNSPLRGVALDVSRAADTGREVAL